MSGQKFIEFYQKVRRDFAEKGFDSPALDARLLFKSVLNVDDADFITGKDAAISQEQLEALSVLINKRLNGEPISRILGQREFWGMNFKVTAATLDPRPDTEILVEAALVKFQEKPPQRIIDLGTGTGCIIITLLKEFPNATGVAVDISEEALDVARFNAKAHGVVDRLSFVQSNWFENIEGQFDLITSNPPYIPNLDIESLDVGVRNHDPILALSGGDDGLDAYRDILRQIKGHAYPHSYCYLEIGIGQVPDLMRLVEESNMRVCRIIPDLAGIPRTVEVACGDK
jgi:release factor glutamine methyltransferase